MEGKLFAQLQMAFFFAYFSANLLQQRVCRFF